MSAPLRRVLVAAAILLAVLLLVGLVLVLTGDDDPAPGSASPQMPGTTTTTTTSTTSSVAETTTTGSQPPAPPSTAAPRAPAAPDRATRLGAVRSWAFPLGASLTEKPAAQVAKGLAGFDLVVLDGQEAPAAVVAAVRAQGAIVLGYVNVGAIEQNRPWTAAASPYRLDHWEQWDEWYADVNQPGFRSLITDTVVPPILDKGFDGLFLDNVDMVDTHPAQRAAMVQLVARLSAAVRARGGYLFAQNGEDDTVDAIAPHLDGWNREDVSFTYDGDAYTATDPDDRRAALATIRRLRARGLLVTSIDYLDRFDGPDVDAALGAACRAGAVASVGDINLTRIFPPRRCS